MQVKNDYINTRQSIEQLLQIWQDAESFNKDEALQEIINYTNNIVDNPRVMQISAIDFQQDYRLSKQCCPFCNTPLSTLSYEEGRDECFETMYYQMCSDGCGKYSSLNE